jgi:hypothetical protein
MRLSLSALFLMAAAPGAFCCAIVGRPDDSVRIESERAIIIWDAARKVEHFIREARFDGKAKADFGFLVPTPTQPELAEVDPEAFAYVMRLAGMQKVLVASAPRAAEQKAGVKVLERKKVGGMDAVVLEAGDPVALDRWLKKNGYVSGPVLLEWYRPYVADGWKITAFKIDAEDGRATPSPVRMSFQAERPFFPYREPPTKGNDRLLRVYFVSDARYDAALAADARWPGHASWSGSIPPQSREGLMKLVKLSRAEAVNAAWLTEFEDRASPRPAGGELFFARASRQTAFERGMSENGHGVLAWIWLGVLILVVALLAVAFRQSRKSNG